MPLLKKHHSHTSTLFRALLAIVFIVWLASVMIQYDENNYLQKPEITPQQPFRHLVIKQLALPPIPKPKTTPQTSALPTLAKPSEKQKSKGVKQSPAISKEQVEQVYQNLTDSGIDIQIAWPRRANERQAALDFMYQCAGVQFAVLNGNTLTKTDHATLNQTELNDYSDWIRVAQGSLSNTEHNWLNAYNLTGTPIRLFPRDIDWRLAQHLANTLNGKALVNFRARYQVTNQTLQLTDIYINKQLIKDSWVLYQGKC
jgi:hypothetical protein